MYIIKLGIVLCWTWSSTQAPPPPFMKRVEVPQDAYLNLPRNPHKPMRTYAAIAQAGVITPYTTFDGATIHESGRCSYLLAEPCLSHLPTEWRWKVSVVNEESTNSPKFVVVRVMAHIIKLTRGQLAKVDNRLCQGDDFPCNAAFNRIRVGKLSGRYDKDGLYVYVEEFHLLVTFTQHPEDLGEDEPARYCITVMLLSNYQEMDDLHFYKGGMCGMLGNFNNNITDDVNPDDPRQVLNANWQNKEICGF